MINAMNRLVLHGVAVNVSGSNDKFLRSCEGAG
jgi:hypothetical protein